MINDQAATRVETGGAGRDRTDDLKLAKLPLSQLSYSPFRVTLNRRARSPTAWLSPHKRRRLNGSPFLTEQIATPRYRLTMVGLGRFELPTSPLSGVRSNQLSYRPDIIRTLHIDQSSRITAEPNDRSANQTIALLIREPRLRFQNREGMPGRRARRTRVPRGACCKGKCVEDEGLNPDPTARFLRKEVIQPQVPLRLPCYDFTPVADLTVAGCFLAVSPPSSGKTNSHGVTGGVYKARERIHRGMLIRDY